MGEGVYCVGKWLNNDCFYHAVCFFLRMISPINNPMITPTTPPPKANNTLFESPILDAVMDTPSPETASRLFQVLCKPDFMM